MMDYVELIKMIRTKYNAEDQAVIAFGGSYGGMLAAWLRMKYPATFQGALAASAPILQFQGAPTAPENKYFDIITNDFAGTYEDQRCSKGLKEAFTYIMALKTGIQADWDEVSTLMSTCKKIDSADMLQDLYEHYSSAF